MLSNKLAKIVKLLIETMALALIAVIVEVLVFLIIFFLPFLPNVLVRLSLGSFAVGIGAGILAIKSNNTSTIRYVSLLISISKILEISITTSIEALIPISYLEGDNLTFFLRFKHLIILNFLPEQLMKNMMLIILSILIAYLITLLSG